MLACSNCKRGTPGHEPAARGILINISTRKRVWVKLQKRGRVLRDQFQARCEDCGHVWFVIRGKNGNWHTVTSST